LYNVKGGKINDWTAVHEFYKKQGVAYETYKLHHAYTSLLEVLNITPRQFTPELLKQLLQQFLTTRTWMCKGIYDSRAKDYSNPFRKMVYETNEEMNKVLGRLEDNSFIQQQMAALDAMKKEVKAVVRKLKL
jgi:glycyl-tRNA synthetase beta subunit